MSRVCLITHSNWSPITGEKGHRKEVKRNSNMRCYMFIFSLVAVLGGGFRYVHVQLLLGMMMGHPQVRICFKSTKTTKLRIYIYIFNCTTPVQLGYTSQHFRRWCRITHQKSKKKLNPHVMHLSYLQKRWLCRDDRNVMECNFSFGCLGK